MTKTIGLRPLLLLLVMVLVLGTIAGCTPKAAAPKEIVIRRAGLEPQQIDNHVNTTNNTLHFSRQVYSCLARVNPQTLELEPEAAESWAVSDEGKTYTFKLKKGIKFTNGKELTAEDVKFTFERILDPAIGAVTSWVFADHFAGAEDMKSGKVKTLDSIKVIDPYTVSITLEAPFAPFLKQIATGYGSIYPREACAAAGIDWAQHPIGSGPFKVAKWERDSLLVLEKNRDYFEKGLPVPDRVEYVVMPDRATEELEFEAGKIDWMTVPVDRYDRYAKSKWGEYIVETKPYTTYFLAFNTEWGPLKDVRVRQAISLGIDREKFCAQIMAGHASPAKTLLPPGILGYDETLPALEYNPGKAKQLLAEAGYANGVTIECWQTTTAETTFRWNVAIQEMLKEIGVDWKIVRMDAAALSEAGQGGRRPASWSGWWADYIDPENFHNPWLHSSHSKSVSTNYNNPEVDRLIDEGAVEQDPVTRAAMYTEVEKLAVQRDMVVAPVFHIKNYAVTQPWLKGVIYLAPTALENFVKATVEGKK